MNIFEWFVLGFVILPLGIFLWGTAIVVLSNLPNIIKIGKLSGSITKETK